MAWVTPATFVAAAVLTAAQLNQNVRDNTAFLYGGSAGTAPGFSAYQNAVTACANGTETTILFQATDENIDTMYATGTGIATVPRAGLWLFTGTLEWASNATGTRAIHLETNTANRGAWKWMEASTDATGRESAALLVYLAASATVKCRGRQSSGGSLNTSGTISSAFAGRWLGA